MSECGLRYDGANVLQPMTRSIDESNVELIVDSVVESNVEPVVESNLVACPDVSREGVPGGGSGA